jgi:ferric-dicitrate binding protein FerR (iron transport regulator)
MTERNDESRREALLTRVLKASGRGPTASPDAKARVYAVVRARWQATQPRRADITPIRPSAARAWVLTRRIVLAVAVALAAVLVYRFQTPFGDSAASFGKITKIDGNVAIRHSGDQRSVRVTDLVGVHAGDTLATDSGARVALELENGSSLRINTGSEVEIVAADRIALRSGTVYFDSQGETFDGSFEIETSLGLVRHVGTQFEASLVGSGLRIRVREGSVAFNDATRELVASGGEVVQIEGAGAPQRGAIAVDDDAWSWAVDLAILPVADEYSLSEVLAWISRETGRDVRFADAAVQARVQTIILYDLGNLTPQETLAVLRSTTAFEYSETDDGLLVVSSTR